MSDWTTRLPYAHRYITKTLFEGAEADLDPPEEITSMDPIHEMRPTHMHRRVYSRCSTTVHLERIKRYYYEVSITRGVQGSESYKWLTIGYTTFPAAIHYANDGAVFTNTPGDQGHVAIPYDAGDIIGCGYEFPSRFFFTKNGIYLGHCIAHLGSNTLRPQVTSWAISLDFHEPMNLGQRPFMFDIEGHLDKRCARLRRLAAAIPLEILENVLQFALLSQGTNHLLRLSRVCRRWRTLLSRSVYELSISTRKGLEDVLEILRAKTPIHARNVTIQESSGEAWLHHFLTSPLSHIKSTSTLGIRTLEGRRRFVEKAPSILSSRIPGILRYTFAEVHTLELSSYSFPTWTRFAQVVFALQRLETLVCKDVTWDTSPPTPPTWLRFSKRLRRASFGDMGKQCIAESLWLFLAGRPLQISDDLELVPSDISNLGKLVPLILWSNSFTIVYEQKQDESRSFRLSVTNDIFMASERSPDPDPPLTFERHGATYQLTRLYARLNGKTCLGSDGSTIREIGMHAAALSSADLCRFRFEVSNGIHGGRSQLRRMMAKAMMRQHTAGLLECTWDGEAIEDTEGVQWLKTGAAVTFGVEKIYKQGTSGRVTWDVHALRPHFSEPSLPHYLATHIIHWVKLYKNVDQSFGEFIADVAFDINVLDGKVEFVIPEVEPGLYFLAVGDYIYCTQSFQVIQ